MVETGNAGIATKKQQILQAVSGPIALPTVSRKYVYGLALTAAGLLLLPLLYFATIAVICGSLFALLRKADALMASWPPLFKILTICIAVCCGIMLVLGLLKPFLARLPPLKRPRALPRGAEPFLFQFVDHVCDALGAQRPVEICVTCDLNAAAESRGGWFGLLDSRRMSLHLGLPLVAGLSLRQFTGVIAHELGHFTQRTAMPLENIIRRTTDWFHFAAYGHDSIDDWLLRQCVAGGLLAIPGYVARAMIWISRWILKPLARAGAMISCQMSREMEFNADRCEARTVGCKTLTATLWKLRQLSVAHQLSFMDVAAFSQEGRLPDNLVTLVLANTTFVTPKVKKRLRAMMREQKTGYFDTHPADQDRIRLALQQESSGIDPSGILSNRLPATILFDQFDRISKTVTVQFYEEVLNQKIKLKMLHPVDQLVDRQNAEIEAARALRRFFQTDIPRLRPLPLAPESSQPPDTADDAVAQLKFCRDRMLAELPSYKRLVPRYQTAEETLFDAISVQTLVHAKLPFDPVEYRIKNPSAEALADKQARAKEGVANLASKLLPFESEAGNRLSFALQLLQINEIVERIPHGNALQYEIGDLLPAAQFVSRLVGELPSMRTVFYRLMTLSERLNSRTPNRQVIEGIVSQMQSLYRRLVAMQQEMGDHLYPFDHAQATTTLQSFALPRIPNETDLAGLVNVTDQMQSRLVTIQMRLFARLAQAAEKIEAAVGMPPLPEPDDDADD